MIACRARPRAPSRARPRLVVRFGNQVVLDHASITDSGRRARRAGRAQRLGQSRLSADRRGCDSHPTQASAQPAARSRRRLHAAECSSSMNLPACARISASGAQRVSGSDPRIRALRRKRTRQRICSSRSSTSTGWNLEHRIKSLITNLHAPDRGAPGLDLIRRRETSRRALPRAPARPDFLILDEPTNHLDTGSIEMARKISSRATAALALFVTHDRYFLDRIATRVVELSRGKFLQLRRQLHRLPALARAERQAVEEMQEQASEIPASASSSLGAQRLPRATDEIGRSRSSAGFERWPHRRRLKRNSTLICIIRPRRSWRIA